LSGQTKQSQIIYLHGFASGVGSTKARFFKTKFEEVGIDMALLDLNVPTFEKMTLTSQLQLVEHEAQRLVKEGPITLMGSSLGGLLATIASQKLNQYSINRVILMAPAFGIETRWRELIGEEAMTDWQTSGFKSFFHYALKKDLNLSYSFIEDLGRHQTDKLRVSVPTLVFHGLNDASVPIDKSREFGQINSPLVQLKELDDGHELGSSLPAMWQDVERFLQASESYK
jgi:alpha-beta hydrolase superfamily lysophospholipase